MTNSYEIYAGKPEGKKLFVRRDRRWDVIVWTGFK